MGNSFGKKTGLASAVFMLLGVVLVPRSQSATPNVWTDMHAAEQQALAQSIEKELQKRSQEAQSIAANTVFTTNNPPRIQKILGDYAQLYTHVEFLAFIDPNGHLLGVSPGSLTDQARAFAWKNEPWFQEGVAKENEARALFAIAYTEDPFFAGKPRLQLHLRAWNRLQKFMGLLTVRMNLSWLDEIFASYEKHYLFQSVAAYAFRLTQPRPPFTLIDRHKGTLEGELNQKLTLSNQWELSTSILAPAAPVEPPTPAQQTPAASQANMIMTLTENPWISAGLAAAISLLLLVAALLYRRRNHQNSELQTTLEKYQTVLRKKKQRIEALNQGIHSIIEQLARLGKKFQDRRSGIQRWQEESIRSNEHIKNLARRCTAEHETLKKIKSMGAHALANRTPTLTVDPGNPGDEGVRSGTAMPRGTRDTWAGLLQNLDVFIKDFELHEYDVKLVEKFSQQTMESMRSMGEFMNEAQSQNQAMEKLLLKLQPKMAQDLVPVKTSKPSRMKAG